MPQLNCFCVELHTQFLTQTHSKWLDIKCKPELCCGTAVLHAVMLQYCCSALKWSLFSLSARAQDRKPEHFISALTDGRADRWADWWRGWWSAVANEPSSQTSPALQIHRCMLVLIWTPASSCLILCACVWAHSLHSLWICAYFCTTVYISALSKYMSISIWVCGCWPVCVCGVCSDVSACYLIKALLKPRGEPSIPTKTLVLEQWPLQNKCKQLRATSVSIRQTDSSREQGLWLTASYQINWTCGATGRIMQRGAPTLHLHFLDFCGLFSRAAWLR